MGIAVDLRELAEEAEASLRAHGHGPRGEQQLLRKGRVAIRELVALGLLAEDSEGADNAELQHRIERMYPSRLAHHASETGMRNDFAVVQALRDLASGQRAAIAIEKLSESGSKVAVSKVRSLKKVCEYVSRSQLTGPPFPKKRPARSELASDMQAEEKLSLHDLAQRSTAMELQGKSRKLTSSE